MATLKTRIQLRNDSAAKWEANKEVVLKAGEVGIESDTNKMKLGDGTTTWAKLPYFKGDIDLTNLPASGVKFKGDITLAGDYDKVGNVQLSQGTLAADGKTVEELFTEIFTKELQPEITTQPYASLSLTCDSSLEAGTKVTPNWTASFNGGKYTYQSSVSKEQIKAVDGTGVTAKSWSIKKDGVQISTSNKGTHDSFVLGDTAVKFTADAAYDDGNFALSNLNKLSSPVVQIKAGSKTGSYTITPFRKEFVGGTTNMNTIDSALVRGLSGRKLQSGEFEFTANKGDTKLIFACPKGAHTTVRFEYFTMSWESFAGFEKLPNAVKVADIRGGAEGLKDYDVWEYVPAGAFAAPTKYKVLFK